MVSPLVEHVSQTLEALSVPFLVYDSVKLGQLSTALGWAVSLDHSKNGWMYDLIDPIFIHATESYDKLSPKLLTSDGSLYTMSNNLVSSPKNKLFIMKFTKTRNLNIQPQ